MKSKTLISMFILILPLFIAPTSGGYAGFGTMESNYSNIEGIETVVTEFLKADDQHLADWRAVKETFSTPDLDISFDHPSAVVTVANDLYIENEYTLESSNLGLDGKPCATCLKDTRPLTIESDRDLRKLEGSGTAEDPYVITGLNFTDSRDRNNLLQIIGIDAHFLITGNEFNGLFGSMTSILILDSANIRIEDNNITRNALGIVANNVDNLIISGNNIYEHGSDSITLISVTNFDISNNNVYSNGQGVMLSTSSMGIVTGNSISSNNGNGLTLASSTDTTIDSNTIFNNAGDGIFFDDSHNNFILNNEIYGTGSTGSVSLNMMSDIKFESNSIKVDLFAASHGMYIDPSLNNVIDGNYIHDNAGPGLTLEFSDNTIINGNTITNNGMSGVFFIDSDSNTITSNDIHGNGFGIDTSQVEVNSFQELVQFNLFLFGSRAGLYIDPSTDNTFEGNSVTGNAGSGVFFEYSTFSDIVGNIISDNGATGIFFLDSDDNSIVNNQVTNNGVNPDASLISQINMNPFETKLFLQFSRSGMWMDPSHRNEISNNAIVGNEGSGLIFEESTTSTISGNSISSNGLDGISFIDSPSNVIDGNQITDNGYNLLSIFANQVTTDNFQTLAGGLGAGLWLDPSPNNVITNNVISGSFGSGIYLLDTNETLIENNHVFDNEAHGIFLQDSSYNTIASNVLERNGFFDASSIGLDAFGLRGLYLDPSHFNNIIGNNISGSAGDGIFSEGSTNTHIESNRVFDNLGYGINFDALSSASSASDNNFVGNDGTGAQGRDDGVGNVIASNFWSDANNNDTNYDGIADEPYVLDGAAGTADTVPSNIPEGLNFYTATAESSPRKLNAESNGSPLTFKIYMDDGFRVLNVNMSEMWLNGTLNPYSYHIIDILTFTVTFDRLQVNDLVNSLGLEPEYYVTFEVVGRINDGLLEVTARDQVLIHQDEDNTLVLVVGLASGMAIPTLNGSKKEGKISKFLKRFRSIKE